MVLSSVLTLLLAQAPAPPARTGPPQTDETIPVTRGARLFVNNLAGEVNLRTWEKDAVHVVARHQTRTKVIARQTPAGVSITATGTMGPQGSVDYEITAPAWMAARIEGMYNFVTVDGLQGEVFVDTMRGDVAVKNAGGAVTAKSVEGEVRIEGARGKVIANSVNEKVVLADVSGDVTADSINGGVTLTGMAAKSVDVSTVNGDITFDGKVLDGGHYSFGTHNGNLMLGVADNVNATFTIRTYRGNFTTDLPLEGIDAADVRRGKRVSTALGNGSADVSLETFGGAIRLRKASAGRSSAR